GHQEIVRAAESGVGQGGEGIGGVLRCVRGWPSCGSVGGVPGCSVTRPGRGGVGGVLGGVEAGAAGVIDAGADLGAKQGGGEAVGGVLGCGGGRPGCGSVGGVL